MAESIASTFVHPCCVATSGRYVAVKTVGRRLGVGCIDFGNGGSDEMEANDCLVAEGSRAGPVGESELASAGLGNWM